MSRQQPSTSRSAVRRAAGGVCFIVPPILLEQVIREGSADARASALETLAIDSSLRAQRIQTSLLGLAGPPVHHALGGTPQRTIFDAKSQQDENAATVLRREGQASVADQAANAAYDGLGDTYKFYWDVFQRDSIDGAGLPLDGEVHFGLQYNNALWNGARMLFGDGDGHIFTGFTKAIDVIGHELTHGVTESTLGLRYLGQAGALNESISDVFGSLVKQYTLGQTAAAADWLIGAGILGPALHGTALRSMKAPGTAFQGDDQPATMSGYVVTTKDHGGVHTNSGIPNHAFYLLATALGGHAWEKAGAIWYHTLGDSRVKPTATFRTFAQATVRAAGALYGPHSAEQQATTHAWQQVGVLKG
jgi:Zn-dependent metalloprotease